MLEADAHRRRLGVDQGSLCLGNSDAGVPPGFKGETSAHVDYVFFTMLYSLRVWKFRARFYGYRGGRQGGRKQARVWCTVEGTPGESVARPGRQDAVSSGRPMSRGCPRPCPGGMPRPEGTGAQEEIDLAARNGLNLEILYFKKHQLPKARAAFLMISARLADAVPPICSKSWFTPPRAAGLQGRGSCPHRCFLVVSTFLLLPECAEAASALSDGGTGQDGAGSVPDAGGWPANRTRVCVAVAPEANERGREVA